MDIDRITGILEAQQKVISMITSGDALPDCLDAICRLIESLLAEANARTSILLLEDTRLKHGGAPSLPKAYCDLIDGIEIGPRVGSCGTAMYKKRQIIVSDISTDSHWADYKHIALEHGLRACWSSPIMSSSGAVLGSFAIYYTEPKQPDAHHLEMIDRFSNLSALAIEKVQSKQREAELTSKLRDSYGKFSAFTSVMPDLALIIREDGTYSDVYGADNDLFYASPKTLIGRKVQDVLPQEQAVLIMNVIAQALNNGSVEVLEYELDVPRGTRIFEGRVTQINNYDSDNPDHRYVLWMARDVSQRKQVEKQIEKLAFYDPLTNLPNRRLLLEQLRSLIEKAKRYKKFGALLFLDLDDFKRINDSLGHSVGDQLLVKVANRLKPLIRDSDMLARIGGDEFVIILESIETDLDLLCDHAASVAQKLLNAFSDSFCLSDGEYSIGLSIGVSLVQGDTGSADEALKGADTAMYRSKRSGGNQYTFFDPELQKHLDDRLGLEIAILKSIEGGHFSTFFQPQVSVDKKVVGAEALIRWWHPERGLVAPQKFIPIAEQIGVIGKLQQVVLRDSAKLLERLEEQDLIDADFSISINVSAVQFRNTELANELLGALQTLKLKPERIKLEITEGLLIDNVDRACWQMNQLQKQGFRFSIDDFGTGYSSLAYLQNFPINELKIDKCFIDKIHQEDIGLGIVDAIIDLGHHLGYRVITEGVEKEEQISALSEREIAAIQGYFFSQAIPSEQFVEWVSAYHPGSAVSRH